MNNRRVLFVMLFLISIMAARLVGKIEEHDNSVQEFKRIEAERDSLKILCDSLSIHK